MINCVQMHLGVQYTSEIFTINDDSFVPGMLEGDKNRLNYATTLTKPNQVKPRKYSWFLWKRIPKTLTTNRLSR